MQIEHLRVLRAVIENKSMNKAAAELFYTQPTVSAAIKSIEREMGFPVIVRTPKGVVATALGQYIMKDAPVVLGAYDRWRHYAETASTEQPVEVVMVGLTPVDNIFAAIARVQQDNSHLKIDFKIKENVGVSPVSDRISIQYKVPKHAHKLLPSARAAGLRMARIQHDQFNAFTSVCNPLAKRQSIALSDLAAQEVLLYSNPERFPYIDLLKDAGVPISSQTFPVGTLIAAASAIQDAVVLRPSKTVEASSYAGGVAIKELPITDPKMPVDLYVTYPNEERIFDSERQFLDSLREHFPLFEQIDDAE